MIVVSDTSPTNYLVLIELQDLVPKLARLEKTNFRVSPRLLETLLGRTRRD